MASGAQATATTLPPAGCVHASRPLGAIATSDRPIPTATYTACGESAAAEARACSRSPPAVTSESRPPTTAAMPSAPFRSVSGFASGRGLGFGFVPKLTWRAPAAPSEPAAITSRTTAAAKARTAARRPRRGGAAGWSARRARCSASSPAPASGSGAPASIASSRRSSSLDMLDLQRLAQLLEGAREAGVDGSHGEIERARDLLRRHAHPVAQDDDDAPLERQLGHGAEQATVSRRVGRSKVGHVRQLFVRESPLGAQQVEGPVRHDPVQPGSERAAVVEASQRGERTLEPVGGHVVRQRAPPRDRKRGTPRVSPVAAEERSRSFAVAAPRLPNQVPVTWLTHSSAVLYARPALARPANWNSPFVDDWQEQDDALVREFELPSFPAAIEFVDRLAELAESEDHHPDIDIRYRRVTVRWSTHSAGGITEKDRKMAERTSALVAA